MKIIRFECSAKIQDCTCLRDSYLIVFGISIITKCLCYNISVETMLRCWGVCIYKILSPNNINIGCTNAYVSKLKCTGSINNKASLMFA